MPNLWDSMFRATAEVAETGIVMMNSAMRSMQSAIARLSGQEEAGLPVRPPVNGPETLDEATADFVTRMVRIAWITPRTPAGLADATRQALAAPGRSFGALDFADPRFLLTLPMQLPLSFGTLMAQQSLRSLYAAYTVGPRNALQFGSYMLDSFADIDVMISLQYKLQLKQLRELSKADPGNASLHLKLGSLNLKLGLFPDAVEELELAAHDPELRFEALSESVVAAYRGGDYPCAIRNGVAAMTIRPEAERTQFWLFLAAEKLGGYPVDVPEEFRLEVKAGRQPTMLLYEDIAAAVGLDKTSAGRGTAVFPIRGDGYLDVVISSGHAGVNVYRNNGDGTFTDITIGSGLDECVNAFAVAVGDYDNDGLDDLFITRLGFYKGESVLYRNNGDGTFTDVTSEAGVGCWCSGFTAQWVDYDCDGRLDLFVASNLGGLFERKIPNRLFHNNGDGTFTEVARQAGLATENPTIGAAWGDYNNDGYPDVFLSSGVGRPQLFRNNGDGTFTDVTRESGLGGICFGSVSFWVDYDNDGWLDLVQFIWSPETDVLHTLRNGSGPENGNPMRIYHNNRDGTFTLKSAELGINGCWGTMSGNAADLNNDGYVDFFLGNGDPHMNRTEPSVLLEYDGNCSYRDITFSAGLPYTGKGHGANMADLFGDGRMCLIMASGGAYPGDLLTTSVYRPRTLPGNYLNIRLVGTTSNRNALGARLRLVSEGREQHSVVSGGSGFGCLPYEQHFGLASRTSVESLDIRWPSGLTQHLDDLPSNTTIRITEGREGWEEVYAHTDVPAQEVAGAVA